MNYFLSPAGLQMVSGTVTTVATIGSLLIAVWLVRVASNFRQLDWIRQQNDAWNAYNQLRFGNAEAFQAGEYALFNETPISTLSVEALGVVHLRMNNMEKEVRGVFSGLIFDGDYEFLVRQIRLMAANRDAILGFLADECFDSRFRFVVEQIMDAEMAEPINPNDPVFIDIFEQSVTNYRKARRAAFRLRWWRRIYGFVDYM